MKATSAEYKKRYGITFASKVPMAVADRWDAYTRARKERSRKKSDKTGDYERLTRIMMVTEALTEYMNRHPVGGK